MAVCGPTSSPSCRLNRPLSNPIALCKLPWISIRRQKALVTPLSFRTCKEHRSIRPRLFWSIWIKFKEIVGHLTGDSFEIRKEVKTKFTRIVRGKNIIAKTPSEIARHLNLPEPERYTGAAFRRSSATTLADKGISMANLKRHGRWKSDAVCEGYIGNSKKAKTDVADMMLQPPKLVPLMSPAAVPQVQPQIVQIFNYYSTTGVSNNNWVWSTHEYPVRMVHKFKTWRHLKFKIFQSSVASMPSSLTRSCSFEMSLLTRAYWYKIPHKT